MTMRNEREASSAMVGMPRTCAKHERRRYSVRRSFWLILALSVATWALFVAAVLGVKL
jgi:hypothetical protein